MRFREGEPRMSRLFADRTLAERIERSVERDLALFAETCTLLDPSLDAGTLPFAGGLALFLAPGSPVNMIFGAGFDGPVGAEEFVAVESFYAERNTRAAISLCPLADEALVAQLGVRGWMITDFENVLVRELEGGSGELDGGSEALCLPAPASGVGVRVARTAEERARWAAISSSAFRVPEPASLEIVRLGEAMAAREVVTLLTGTVDGQEAGTGALWIDDGMGWMLSDTTLPPHRRRGVQSALLAERTRLAAEAGCELAVTEARPGSSSQRNMERLGYRVVYTRVELIAPPNR
jgi:GNAT superfamily N-acetyltransferase